MTFDPNFLIDVPVPHSDGSFVSPKVDRVIELIRQYDHRLDVRWIPLSRRSIDMPAYAVVCNNADGSEYVVMYVENEDEMDARVLERLYLADNKNHNVLSQVDAHNRAVKAVQAARFEDALAEANDLAQHVWKSRKHVYKHDGKTYR